MKPGHLILATTAAVSAALLLLRCSERKEGSAIANLGAGTPSDGPQESSPTWDGMIRRMPQASDNSGSGLESGSSVDGPTTSRIRFAIEERFARSQEAAHPQGLLDSQWDSYHRALEAALRESPDAALLADYHFVQQEDLVGLAQAEWMQMMNHLNAEMRYLREQGVLWRKGNGEVGSAAAFGLVRSPGVLEFPAEAMLRSPAFPGVDESVVKSNRDLLQSIRLDYLRQYLSLELRMNFLGALILDPTFEFSAQAAPMIQAEMDVLKESMIQHRQEYLRAIGSLVGATDIPVL